MSGKRKKKSILPSRVYEKSGSYYYVTVDNKWLKLGKTFQEAMQTWVKMVEPDITTASVSHITADVIDRYIREIAPLKSEKSYKENIRQSKTLKLVFGELNVEDIKASHVQAFLFERGKTALVSANREYALFAHILKYAVLWNMITTNPCREVDKLEEIPRDRYLEDDEVKKIRDCANDKYKCIIDLGYLTSLRISDILKLKWSDIDDVKGIFSKHKKTGKKQRFDWTQELTELIERIKGLKKSVSSIYVFANRSGQMYSYDGFKTNWDRIIDASKVQNVHFHDLRAKALTDADDAGADAQAMAGHEEEKTTKIYLKNKKTIRVKSANSIANFS